MLSKAFLLLPYATQQHALQQFGASHPCGHSRPLGKVRLFRRRGECPALNERVDVATPSTHGAGVAEMVEVWLTKGLEPVRQHDRAD